MDGGFLEFLLVGESKLKIVMTDDDMKYYKLESLGFDGDSASAKRSFWQILDRAKTEVGFDPTGDKVLIQFYPIKCGGCEVFVTKLGILTSTSAKLVSKSERVSMLSKHCRYYHFENLLDLKRAAVAIKSMAKEAPVSDVYLSQKHGYFLSVEEYEKGSECAEFPSIQEFGQRLAADIGAYISEHFCRLTDGDGVDKFSKI